MIGAHVGEYIDLMQSIGEHSMKPATHWIFMLRVSNAACDWSPTACNWYRLVRRKDGFRLGLAKLLYGGHGITCTGGFVVTLALLSSPLRSSDRRVITTYYVPPRVTSFDVVVAAVVVVVVVVAVLVVLVAVVVAVVAVVVVA